MIYNIKSCKIINWIVISFIVYLGEVILKDRLEKCVPEGMNNPIKTTKRIRRGTAGFTVMFIPDSTDASKTFELTYDRIVKLLTIVVAIIAIIVCLAVALSIRHHDEIYGEEGYIRQIETLTEENNAYKDRDEALTRQISFLTNRVAIMEAEGEDKKDTPTSDIPSLSPLAGVYLMIQDPAPDAEEYRGYRVAYDTMDATQIVATAYGKVISITEDPFYGTCVVIDHENGYKTYYRWNGVVRAKEGQWVLKGTSIGAALEDDVLVCYEVTKNEININPLTVIESEEN